MRDAYCQLSFFDQTVDDNRQLVAIPVLIYEQMVDDLIEHELNDEFFCYTWLIRQI